MCGEESKSDPVLAGRHDYVQVPSRQRGVWFVVLASLDGRLLILCGDVESSLSLIGYIA